MYFNLQNKTKHTTTGTLSNERICHELHQIFQEQCQNLLKVLSIENDSSEFSLGMLISVSHTQA